MKNSEYEQYDNLFPDINNSVSFGISCGLCKKHFNYLGQKIIWGNGARNAKVMIIGKDSAGGDKNERLWKGSKYTLMPLTNKKSGAKIRILLAKAGINPHKVYFTNTVKCNIGYQDEYRLSYEKLVPICTQYLKDEIKIIKPEKIICLGRKTFQQVNGLLKKHNTELNIEQCIYLNHPSRIEGSKYELEYINIIKQIL